MNANLPSGGKSQSNSAPTSQTPTAAGTGTRVVRMERLQKLSAEQLEAKIAALPAKIKRKSDSIEKRISQMRGKLTAYESFKKAEVEAIRRLLVEKKKATPAAPNVGPAKAA